MNGISLRTRRRTGSVTSRFPLAAEIERLDLRLLLANPATSLPDASFGGHDLFRVTGTEVLQSSSGSFDIRVERGGSTSAGHKFQLDLFRAGLATAIGTHTGAKDSTTVFSLPFTSLQAGSNALTFRLTNLELPLTNAPPPNPIDLTGTVFVDLSDPTASLPAGGLRNTGITFGGTDLGATNSGVVSVVLTDSNGPGMTLQSPPVSSDSLSGAYNFGGNQGVHNISITVKDLSGRTATAAATYSLDTIAPAAPGVPDLQASSDTGPSNTDNITADTTPTFDVSGLEAGATLQLLRDGSAVTSVSAGGGGIVSITDPGAPLGTHLYSSRQVDAAGNQGTASGTLSVEITPPVNPGAPDLQAASDTGISTSDNITADKSPTFDLPADRGDTIELLRDGVSVASKTVVVGGAIALTDPGPVPDGIHQYTARKTDAAKNVTISPALAVTIDTTPPSAPSAPDLQASSDSGRKSTDNVTSRTDPTFDVTGVEVGATVRLRRDGVVIASIPNAAAGSLSITDPGRVPDGLHLYTVDQVDVAGNTSAASGPLSVLIDSKKPAAPGTPDLLAADDSGLLSDDNRTSSPLPRFTVSGLEPGALVELLRTVGSNGPVVASAFDGSLGGTVTVTDPAAPEGVIRYSVRQTDAAGNSSISPALTVVIDRTAPNGIASIASGDRSFSGTDLQATASRRPQITVSVTDAPAGFVNGLIADLTAVDGVALASTITVGAVTSVDRNATTLTLDLPANLAPGLHNVAIRVRDVSGNTRNLAPFTFQILENPALVAPGTPVYSTLYDLNSIRASLPDGNKSVPERPWSMAFDRTTQTVWLVFRGEDLVPANTAGNRLVQFDPATGQLHTYSLELPRDAKGNPLFHNSGPHGIAFDFESHLTPRVWFTQRQGGHSGSAAEHGEGAGLLSYLDLSTNELVTYNITALLVANGITKADGSPVEGDVHAVSVDPRGVVWVTDESDGLLLEMDPGGTGGIASRTANLIVHPIPGLRGVPGAATLGGENVLGPHGVEVVVDDRTNEATVYFTTVIEGRFRMLRPGVNGQPDRWYSWDIDPVLRSELGLKVGQIPVGAPLFVTIDTAETPGRPEDDRIYFGDPGFPRRGVGLPNSAVRELIPRGVLLDPTDTVATSPIISWKISGMPDTSGGGGSSAGSQAAPNQVYVDRAGTVYFIDRRSGVGRLDTGVSPGNVFPAPVIRAKVAAKPAIAMAPSRVTPATLLAPTTVTPTAIRSDKQLLAPEDRSATPGLDQYLLKGKQGGSAAQGAGPFRGTFSAGNIVYDSLTQADMLGSTVFAEETRRDTAIVVAPNGARKAFQTLRDGSVILTERDAGGLVDRQRVLTRPGIDPAIVGDVAAVIDHAGAVHAFGRDASGGLADYRLDPLTGVWSSRIVGHAASNLAGNPQAYVDPLRGAAALATTTDGHLVAFFADNGQVVDLTALTGAVIAGRVYSKPGVVVSNGVIYAYGTNQNGALLEYKVSVGGASPTVRRVFLPEGNRDILLQDLEAVDVNGVRHVFGADGSSRLVHVTVRPDGTASAENVTELTKDLAIGYSAYQRPYAARVYGGAKPVVAPDGQIYIYGTNGRDLIEFRRTTAGVWSAENLTNRPANRVFGNPSAYVTPNGDRHVLLINEDGEMVEYYKLNGLDFATTNITLSQANSTTNVPPTFPNTLPGTPLPPGSIPADDHADLPGIAATPLALDPGGAVATISGRIGAAGDSDVFRFVAPRSGRVVIDLKAADRNLDTVLVGLNASNRRLARNDNAHGRTTDSRVTFNVVAGQTYYLVAAGKLRSTGAYTLSARYAGVTILSRGVRIATAAPKPTGSQFGRPWSKMR